MSVITTFQAIPGRLFSIYKFFYDQKNGVNNEELSDYFSPKIFIRGDKESTTVFEECLKEAKKLKMLKIENDKFFLNHNNIDKTIGAYENFQNFMEDKILNIENSKDAGQEDYLYALAWFLMQDPYKLNDFGKVNTQFYKENIQSDIFEKIKINGRDDRWQNFLYWSKFFGFAKLIGKGKVLIDPSEAISKKIKQIFENNNELNISTFINNLAFILPVFEGGKIRKELIDKLALSAEHEQKLSKVTSFSLQKLNLIKKINIEIPRSDGANSMIMQFGNIDSDMRVTHISKGEKFDY